MAEPSTEKIPQEEESSTAILTPDHDVLVDTPKHGGPGLDRNGGAKAADRVRQNINARLANPLAGYTHAELEEMGAAYARKYELGDEEDVQAFRQGAVCAQEPTRYDHYAGLNPRDREVMEREFAHRWSQPRLLYLIIVLCSTCAAVQGMGESGP